MEFGLLGPFHVVMGGRPLAFRSVRLRTLLAALLVRANTAVSIDELTETVWDGEPPPRARQTLYSYVTRLRQAHGSALAGRISTLPSGYLVETRPGELDLERFRAGVDTGLAAIRGEDWVRGAESLRAALELWRGLPLADVPSEALRRRVVGGWEEQWFQALEWRFDAEHVLGRHAETVVELRELVAAHPFRERFAAQLMAALHRQSRQAEALVVYRDTRRRLVEELGVEPGSALREEQRRVLAGEERAGGAGLIADQGSDGSALTGPTGAITVLHQLPPDLEWFTGREKPLAELIAFATRERTGAAPRTAVVSVIEGVPGVGKTQLAVHVAHRLVAAGRFADVQLYGNLRGFDPEHGPVRPADVLGAFLRQLGVPATHVPESVDERAAMFRDRMLDRDALVLLDDAADEKQVRDLIPASPACLVLVTSRRSLTALDGAALFPLDVFTRDEAQGLLSRVIGAERVAAEPEAAREIVRLCGYLPPAVSLAAGCLRSRPAWRLAFLADRLRERAPDAVQERLRGLHGF